MKASLLTVAFCCFAIGLPVLAGCGDAKTDSKKSGHQPHGDEDKLMWDEGKEVDHEGYKISLAWHGEHIHAGEKDEPLEPAAMITKDGKPVTGVKVFVSLLADDETTVLAEEGETEFETATDDEPAHYAGKLLQVPAGLKSAFIKFRVVFPGGEEKLYNVKIEPHADED